MIFDWAGSPPASKSILNRLLILRSFQPDLQIDGDSDCDDVVAMRAALAAFAQGLASGRREATLDCGAAGAVLRFLAPRVAREPGAWLLTGDARLLERPHGGLLEALGALGIETTLGPAGLEIRSREGWRRPSRPVRVERSASSQFASGLALAAVGLDFDLELEWTGGASVSDGYWEMTMRMARVAGLAIEANASGARIARGQRVRAARMEAEVDASSAFALAALAAVGGRARLERFPFAGAQPDIAFAGLLEAMGAGVRRDGAALIIERPAGGAPLRALPAADLRHAPDLFPVLAALGAFAEGTTRLGGAPHLAHKESSRIESTLSLLRLVGARAQATAGGLEVEGLHGQAGARDPAPFDPAGDHRLAMAAAVVNLSRAQRGERRIEILRPDVVAKSFPGFWRELARGGLA